MAYDTATRSLKVVVLAFGQLISLSSAMGALLSQILVITYGIHLPAFQMLCSYLVLMMVYTIPFFVARRKTGKTDQHMELDNIHDIDVSSNPCAARCDPPPSPTETQHITIVPAPESCSTSTSSPAWLQWVHGHKQLFLAGVAFCDVEANFSYIWAYRFTSVSSVMLAASVSVPCVMALARMLFRVKYRIPHYAGAITALIGMMCIVYADSQSNENVQEFEYAYIGDGIAAIGAILFALVDTGDEIAVHEFGRPRLLASLGLYGSLIACVQAVIFEYFLLDTLYVSWGALGCLLGFLLCMFTLYTYVTVFYSMSTAVVFNLSLQTSNVYAMVGAIIVFAVSPSPVYWLGFILILSGLVYYGSTPVGVR